MCYYYSNLFAVSFTLLSITNQNGVSILILNNNNEIPHEYACILAFITSQLKSKPHPYWIGMTKTGSNWYWTDGISNVQYTNWAPSEPNGGEDVNNFFLKIKHRVQ